MSLQRRHFLNTLAVGSAVTGLCTLSSPVFATDDRRRVGAIGVGGRGSRITQNASKFAEIVAVCDVDSQRAEANASKYFGASVSEDYRDLLDRQDIDAVVIATPDHWHSKIAIEAMLAGKDVYCEKPLTLTIEEGRLINQVATRTGRIVQVGTQQRSEFGGFFLQAVAMVHAGRIGELKSVTASTGGGQTGGPFPTSKVPSHLNWDRWLGQTPEVPYTAERCHGNFRWWREYAGGQMTDWGAHHVDIALWAIGIPDAGKLMLSGTGQVPQVKNGYNMPAQFDVTCTMPNGLPLKMVTGQRQGITFEGTRGRFFVNRGGIYGKPVEQLVDNPLPEDAITKLYKGKQPGDHMGNFFECVASREEPISDVFSHHRAVTVLHLANLCLLLGRDLEWDLAREQIVGDDEANSHQRREQRQGYQIVI